MAAQRNSTPSGGSSEELASIAIASPVGRLKLLATGEALVGVLWDRDRDEGARTRMSPAADRPSPGHRVLRAAVTQLDEYFAGGRTSFSLPLELRGTAFQKRVWEALQGIPFGETMTYGQLARQLGAPEATRAVGAANGRNPLSIIVPCHRVIGASGKLTGFAGGLATKAHLLALEGGAGDLFLRLPPD